MNREEINFYLQYADKNRLKNLIKKIKQAEEVSIILKPQQCTLMLPIREPVAKIVFYAGEVLVTQCYVEVNKIKGWSMVMDYNPELSENIAICDSCFSQEKYISEIKELVLEAKNIIENELNKELKMVSNTLANFETME